MVLWYFKYSKKMLAKFQFINFVKKLKRGQNIILFSTASNLHRLKISNLKIDDSGGCPSLPINIKIDNKL